MPSKDEHLAQAAHNEKFASSIPDWPHSEHRDWVLTALFYAALHLVDARLDRYGIHPLSHARRERCLETLADFKNVKRQYYDLQHGSENARYGLVIPSAKDLTDLYLLRLNHIKKEIGALLGTKL